MLTMNLHLILGVACGLLSGQALSAAPAEQVAANTAQTPGAAPAKAASPHQLTEQQRAELRRQLYQYRRLTNKGS